MRNQYMYSDTNSQQSKDTSKYNQVLAQALESIRARSAYIKVRFTASNETQSLAIIIYLAVNWGFGGVATQYYQAMIL